MARTPVRSAIQMHTYLRDLFLKYYAGTENSRVYYKCTFKTFRNKYKAALFILHRKTHIQCYKTELPMYRLICTIYK